MNKEQIKPFVFSKGNEIMPFDGTIAVFISSLIKTNKVQNYLLESTV